ATREKESGSTRSGSGQSRTVRATGYRSRAPREAWRRPRSEPSLSRRQRTGNQLGPGARPRSGDVPADQGKREEHRGHRSGDERDGETTGERTNDSAEVVGGDSRAGDRRAEARVCQQ